MPRRLTFPILALSLLAIVGLATKSRAGLVTGTPGTPPYTKLALYGRVLTVVDASGRALEFGNAGRDIAGTDDIVFRPSDANGVAAQGITVRSNGTTADLYISGDLCLQNHTGGAEDCRHVMPAVSSTQWQLVSATYNYLEPKPSSGATPGMQIGTAANPITSGAALTLSGTGGQNFNIQNTSTSASAARFDGDFVAQFGVAIGGALYVNGRDVWHRQNNLSINEGTASKQGGDQFGLDADRANGSQVTIEPASSCANSDGTHPRVACVCFDVRYAKTDPYWIYDIFRSAPNKHCTDLANRP